jgi:hypothetical protein
MERRNRDSGAMNNSRVRTIINEIALAGRSRASRQRI